MDVTLHYSFELLAPSQEQPEVPLNFNWNKLDALLWGGLGGAITVKEVGDSPDGDAFNVTELDFIGATVTQESNGRALITIQYPSDSPEGGGGGDVDSPDTDTTPVVIQLACSDLVTALTVADAVAYCRAPQAFTLTGVRSSLQTVSSSGLVTVDILKNAVTVLSTALSIDAGAKTSTTAATPAVISVSAIGDDDELRIDIDAAGTGAKGLIVTLIGHV